MFNYLIRRILYAVPILIGVLLLTFVLFFASQTPESLAARVLGPNARAEAKKEWIARRGYDKPLLVNTQPGARIWDSQFCNFIWRVSHFDLGLSDKTGESLNSKFAEGAIPSLCITLPAFLVGLCFSIGLALYQVFVRNSALDRLGTFVCVALMSIPAMQETSRASPSLTPTNRDFDIVIVIDHLPMKGRNCPEFLTGSIILR